MRGVPSAIAPALTQSTNSSRTTSVQRANRRRRRSAGEDSKRFGHANPKSNCQLPCAAEGLRNAAAEILAENDADTTPAHPLRYTLAGADEFAGSGNPSRNSISRGRPMTTSVARVNGTLMLDAGQNGQRHRLAGSDQKLERHQRDSQRQGKDGADPASSQATQHRYKSGKNH